MNIQVSGLMEFSGEEWRKALLYYLQGIWSGDGSVTYRPKVYLKDVGFRTSIDCQVPSSVPGTYRLYAYPSAFARTPAIVGEDQTLRTGTCAVEFEAALVRFIRNDSLMKLIVTGRDDENKPLRLIFWKKRKERSFLGIAASYDIS